MTVVRTITQHDPTTRLNGDLAGWIIADEHLPFCDEIICYSQRVILVDSRRFNDLDWCLAHAFAHLDLGHAQDGDTDGAPFSCQQEKDADDLARIMLDMEWDVEPQPQMFDLPAMDGPPTVRAFD
jgi:hypothetical protein